MLKKETTKRILLLLLCVSLIVSVLAGCSKQPTEDGDQKDESAANTPNTPDDSANGEEITITVLNWLDTDYNDAPMMREIVKAYEAEHEGVKIEVITDCGVDAASVSQLAQAGAMPDVFFVSDLYSTVVNEWSIDLTPYFDADPRTENYVQYLRDLMTYDGKLHGMCSLILGNCLLVNLDAVNNYNLDLPDYDWTVDEYLELVLGTKVPGECIGAHVAQDMLRYLPQTYDSSLNWYSFDTDTYSFRFDDAWVKSVNVIKQISDEQASITESIDQFGREWTIDDADEAEAVLSTRLTWMQDNIGTLEDPWLTGHLGTTIWGSWSMPMMEDNVLWSDFEWDIYPFPVASEGDVSRAPQMVEFMTVSSACPEEERQAAYDFLSWWCLSVEAYQLKADYVKSYSRDQAVADNPDLAYETIATNLSLGWVPPVKDEQFTEILYATYPELAEKEGWRYIWENIDQGYCDLSRIVPGWNEAYESYINESLIVSIYSGKRTAADMAQEMQDLCNTIISTRLEEMGGK